jgi:hypothetical protein
MTDITCYWLRANLTAGDPSVLRARYVQLTQIETVNSAYAPFCHPLQHRANAHIQIAFLASFADHPQASATAARSGVDAHGGAGESWQKSKCKRAMFGFPRRSPLVDFAALHLTFRQQRAALRENRDWSCRGSRHRGPHYAKAKREQRNRSPDGPLAGPFVVEIFQ